MLPSAKRRQRVLEARANELRVRIVRRDERAQGEKHRIAVEEARMRVASPGVDAEAARPRVECLRRLAGRQEARAQPHAELDEGARPRQPDQERQKGYVSRPGRVRQARGQLIERPHPIPQVRRPVPALHVGLQSLQPTRARRRGPFPWAMTLGWLVMTAHDTEASRWPSSTSATFSEARSARRRDTCDVHSGDRGPVRAFEDSLIEPARN